jgi:MFS family permease
MGPVTTAPTAAPPTTRERWSALGAGFAVLFVCTGVNFSFGILFKAILREFGGDRATLSFAATVSLIIYSVAQPLFGSLVDRYGPRRVILPSMALMALGMGLTGLAQSTWQFILLYGVVASIGYTGTSILPISIHISRWFPGQRGFIMAVGACGFSLGQLVFTQVAAYAVVGMGWRRTYLLMAVLLVLFLVVFVAWLRDPPPAAAAPGAPGPAMGIAGSMTRRAAMGTPAFWWMAGGYVWCGFTDFLMTTHLPPFTTDLGLSATAAANAISIWSAANIAGILLAGEFADRFGTRLAMVMTYLIRAASLVLLLTVHNTWQLYVFAFFFGASFFTTAPLTATFVGTLFGPMYQGAIFGAANMIHHAGGAVGSYLGGLTYDLTRSYTPIFAASAVLVVASALLTALAHPPRQRR